MRKNALLVGYYARNLLARIGSPKGTLMWVMAFSALGLVASFYGVGTPAGASYDEYEAPWRGLGLRYLISMGCVFGAMGGCAALWFFQRHCQSGERGQRALLGGLMIALPALALLLGMSSEALVFACACLSWGWVALAMKPFWPGAQSGDTLRRLVACAACALISCAVALLLSPGDWAGYKALASDPQGRSFLLLMGAAGMLVAVALGLLGIWAIATLPGWAKGLWAWLRATLRESADLSGEERAKIEALSLGRQIQGQGRSGVRGVGPRL